MGKKLAIRGHSTRGKEVIELLEMMGGKNVRKLDGEANMYSYYLYDNAILSDRLSIAEDDDFEIFTLQDFLEKFPYKVGDKVHIYVQNDDVDGRYDTDAVEIVSMRWNPTIRKIAYKMKNINREFYKEEIKCKVDDSNKPTKDMGKKLAIRGHSTRGKEVIGILEMMGGHATIIKEISNETDKVFFNSDNENCFYRKSIRFIPDSSKEIEEFAVFTLEEFLEKFPFKVHDLVNIPEYESTVGICGMKWDPYSKHMEYMVYRCDDEEWYTAEELLNYNDNPNEINKDMEQKDKAKAPNLKGEDYSGKRFGYKIPDGYEFDTITNGKIILKPIKPKYPTTYDECEKILGLEGSIIEGCLGYEYKRLNAFQKLLMCRDAYWKIAGEQKGLDKPWKADFTQGSGIKYIILFANGEVIWNRQECETVTGSRVLAFSTAEMRDAFYKNFKDLIEDCKELL